MGVYYCKVQNGVSTDVVDVFVYPVWSTAIVTNCKLTQIKK